jgi:hypothetical protein
VGAPPPPGGGGALALLRLLLLLVLLLVLLLFYLPLVLPLDRPLLRLPLLYLLGNLFLQQLRVRLFRLLLIQLPWPTLLHLCPQQIQFYLELDLLLAVAAVTQLKFR